MRQSPSPRVVIVPARNEGERIGATLGALAELEHRLTGRTARGFLQRARQLRDVRRAAGARR
jgi:hypothetical protein